MKKKTLFISVTIALLLVGIIKGISSNMPAWLGYRCHYVNETAYNVTLEGYFGAEHEGEKQHLWEIESHTELKMSHHAHAHIDRVVFFCDSLRIIFNGERELWFRRCDNLDANILKEKFAKRERVNNHVISFTYEITEDMYNKSTPIN